MKLANLVVTLAGLIIFAGPVAAQTPHPEVRIEGAWARSTPPNAKTGAAYMTIVNAGHEPATLMSASTPVAGMADVHRSYEENGVMKMRAVGPVELKPGESLKLAPGGYHVMLMDLKQPLTAGQTFPVTLDFKSGGHIVAMVHVQNSPPAGATNMQHMDQMNMK